MTTYTFQSKDENTQNGEVVYWFTAHNPELEDYNGSEFGVVIGDNETTVVDDESCPIEGNWYVHLLDYIESEAFTLSNLDSDIELNEGLENPTAFFTLDGQLVALDLVTHELRATETNGAIIPELHEIQPEVNQDWDNESTTFEFEDYTVVYTNNEVKLIPNN